MQKRALCLRRGVKGQGRTYTLQAIVLWFQSRFKRLEIRFRSGVISSELYAAIAIFQFLAPQKIIRGLSPIWLWRWKLHFPPIVWKKFHENPFSRSREWLSHILWRTEKKQNRKKQKKTSVKHIRICAT